MIFGDRDVMLMTRDGSEIVDIGEWSDELEERAREIGGYLVVVNSEPADIVADYRPVGIAYQDVVLLSDLVETALQEPGFFDSRVESEARPMTEELLRTLTDALQSRNSGGSLTVRMATEPAVLEIYSGEVIGEYANDDGGAYILLRFPDMRHAARWSETTGLNHRATLAMDGTEVKFNDSVVLRVHASY